MSNNKFKPIEDWIDRVRKGDCDNFIAMACNKEKKFFGACKSSIDALATMLLTASQKDEDIAHAIVATATIIVSDAEKKGGQQ